MSDKKTLMEMVRKIGGVQQVKESRIGEVDMVMQDIASGELDAHEVMYNPQTPEEQAAAQFLHRQAREVAVEHGLDPEADMDEIIDIVCDNICAQYAAESAKPSKEVMEAMKIAGLPISERWGDDDYDDDEDRDVKIAMSDKRQQAFEKRAKKVVGKVDPDKDISRMAKNNSKKDDDEEEKPAAKAAPAKKAAPAEKKPAPAAEKKEDAPAKPARGSFTAIAKPMLARGASTADIRAALTKAGVSTNHLHSRLHSLRKGLKEGFVLVHPHMPSFVLAENQMMNQYQWISEKDDATSLQPMVFVNEAEAQKVIKYMVEFKNQQAVLTKVQLGD